MPLSTVHDIFRKSQCENSVLLSNYAMTAEPMPTEVVAAHIAASRLCHEKGYIFENEHERATAFDSCVVDLFREWEKERILEPESFTNYGKVNQYILEHN